MPSIRPHLLVRPAGLLWLLIVVTAQAKDNIDTDLIGHWVLNEERSAQVQPEQPDSRNWLGGGKVNTSITMGGIPLPGTGGKQGPISAQPAKDPDILRCKSLDIAAADDGLLFRYAEVGKELFRQGKYRGAHTQWSERRFRSRYRSTERRVAHDLQLQHDGSLLVTVTIKADGTPKRTYKQVFERSGSKQVDVAAEDG